MATQPQDTGSRLRVCFLYFGDQQPALARIMIESVRRHMPNAVVSQLTNRTSKALDEVDEVRRVDGNGYGFLLWQHMRSVPEPFIRLDYDMVLQESLEHTLVGDEEFDIALNEQTDTRALSSEYGAKYPIAGSVWVGKRKAREFADHFRGVHLALELDDWLGLVPAVNEAVTSPEFKVKILAGERYNYIPKDRDDKPAGMSILHYKGRRKRWMLPQEQEHLAYGDEKRVSERIGLYKRRDELPLVGLKTPKRRVG